MTLVARLRRRCARPSRGTPQTGEIELEDCKPLVDEAAFGQHGDCKAALAHLLEKHLRIAEGRQHDERRSARLEMIGQACCKTLGDIRRSPRALAVVAR